MNENEWMDEWINQSVSRHITKFNLQTTSTVWNHNMAKVVVSVSGGIGYTALGSLIFSTATFVRGTACKESFLIRSHDCKWVYCVISKKCVFDNG